MAKVYVGLYQEHVSNLRTSLQTLEEDGFDIMVAPIVNPLLYRNFNDEPMKSRHLVFSRSDLILESADWHHKIIAKISDYIDCDSTNEGIRKHSEQTLHQELSFAEHLLMTGSVLIKLKSARTVNLARILSKQIKSK